ncbi:MAG: FAD-dependent oxidoreductase, partial [Oscillospiraceae bacterium]|nr:FAD-dependent oxidoreductase [Oscillospiraceae bacterium]
DIPFVQAGRVEVRGEQTVTAAVLDGEEIPCSCVFILRASVAPTDLLPALELDGSYIKVDRTMATSVPGVFAAGDCTGKPLQVAKAVGEGHVAGLSACEYLDQQQK